MRTLYASALRREEMAMCLFADLCLDEGRIWVRDGKEHIDRYTLIDPMTADMLREWQGNKPASHRVFSASPRTIARILHRTAAKAGLLEVHTGAAIGPHALRKAHISHCYHSGPATPVWPVSTSSPDG